MKSAQVATWKRAKSISTLKKTNNKKLDEKETLESEKNHENSKFN